MNVKAKFREDKAIQAAALFIKLRGGRISHLKLMKLLYIAEREALIRWRRPIIFDSYVSMDLGPVPSRTLNLMHGEGKDTVAWDNYISPTSQSQNTAQNQNNS